MIHIINVQKKYAGVCKQSPLRDTLLILSLFFTISGCKKLVAIPSPVSSITTEQVFATPAEATSAMAGIYAELIHGNASFANYPVTVFCGMSADELTNINNFNEWPQFANNNLHSENVIVGNTFWKSLYTNIYRSNAILEGLQNSVVSDSLKKELMGEAKFIRAFCNFYLVNLFGPIPIVTTVNWRNTNLLYRSQEQDVYALIVEDLIEAKRMLPINYSVGKGERIIPNSTAASALLARTYLYMKDWAKASDEASIVINRPEIALESLHNIFSSNSKEAIWQLKQNNALGNSYNTTPEGFFIRPRARNAAYRPNAWITENFLSSVQPGDQRRNAWVDSTFYTVDKTLYYFPGKYTQGLGETVINGPYKQYYMVLRLAEQYLIRAEAHLQQNQIAEAISDLNKIRQRANLPLLSTTLSLEQTMKALINERRMEFFSEWGHRWLDLKRWDIADKVLGEAKGDTWNTADKLYPIPSAEIKRNHKITQNEGY